MHKYIYTLILLIPFFKINAQQTSLFTQAAEDFELINPAGLTFEEMRLKGMVINLNIRNQWWNAQAEGQPTTQALSWLQNKNEHNHFGATLISDRVGETRDLGLTLRYAHTLAPGLKIGLGIGGISHRIAIGELDQFDENDPIAEVAGDTRWKLTTNAGIFYSHFNEDRAWNWFAGGAFQKVFFTNDLPGVGETKAESHLLVHGGIGWNKSWWLGNRLRFSANLPNAIDLYLRKYFAEQVFYIGAIATADKNHQTIGGQFGYEWLINSNSFGKGHHIMASIAFSKPLFNYLQGNNIIFDARITWALDQRGEF